MIGYPVAWIIYTSKAPGHLTYDQVNMRYESVSMTEPARLKPVPTASIDQADTPSSPSNRAGSADIQGEGLLHLEAKNHASRPRGSQNQVEHRYARIPSRSTGWVNEIVSCVFASVAFTSLVILLYTFNKQPLPNLPRMISFNTIIALITAILKASLMLPVAEGISQAKWKWYSNPNLLSDIELFDEASRSPWGSLLLLLHFKKQ